MTYYMVSGRVAGDGTDFMAHMQFLGVGGRVDVRDGVTTGHVYVPEGDVSRIAAEFLIDVNVTVALAPPERRR
jgi:5-deoxy-D-glucuronate isomerase